MNGVGALAYGARSFEARSCASGPRPGWEDSEIAHERWSAMSESGIHRNRRCTEHDKAHAEAAQRSAQRWECCSSYQSRFGRRCRQALTMREWDACVKSTASDLCFHLTLEPNQTDVVDATRVRRSATGAKLRQLVPRCDTGAFRPAAGISACARVGGAHSPPPA